MLYKPGQSGTHTVLASAFQVGLFSCSHATHNGRSHNFLCNLGSQRSQCSALHIKQKAMLNGHIEQKKEDIPALRKNQPLALGSKHWYLSLPDIYLCYKTKATLSWVDLATGSSDRFNRKNAKSKEQHLLLLRNDVRLWLPTGRPTRRAEAPARAAWAG